MTNNDIVERLRGFWLPNDTASLIRDEAADEINRLREELTASHESHGNEVGALTERLSLAIHERDEARRSVCKMSIQLGGVYCRVGGKTVEVTTAEGCAEIMRWDCFKEASDERHC